MKEPISDREFEAASILQKLQATNFVMTPEIEKSIRAYNHSIKGVSRVNRFRFLKFSPCGDKQWLKRELDNIPNDFT